MTTVMIAVVVLAVLGAIFGLVLAIASKVFAVEVDPREEAILGCLPGANCGGCGYPGCSGYASAVVKGVAPVNACAAGGEAVAAQIDQEVQRLVADAYDRCERILNDNRDKLEAVASYLLEHETMEREAFLAVFGEQPLSLKKEEV